MGVLLIGDIEKKAIEIAVTRARANAMPWGIAEEIAIGGNVRVLKLEDRGNLVASIKHEFPSYHVQLGTYHAAISFEEQPVGIVRHLSISTRDPGMVPNESVMRAVTEAFGFSDFPPLRPYSVWYEEFAPRHMAINIAELEP